MRSFFCSRPRFRVAAPMLTAQGKVCLPAVTCVFSTVLRMRSAICSAPFLSAPTRPTANSSPPYRATKSMVRTDFLMIPAKAVEFLGELLHEGAMVQEAGKAVGEGHVHDLLVHDHAVHHHGDLVHEHIEKMTLIFRKRAGPQGPQEKRADELLAGRQGPAGKRAEPLKSVPVAEEADPLAPAAEVVEVIGGDAALFPLAEHLAHDGAFFHGETPALPTAFFGFKQGLEKRNDLCEDRGVGGSGKDGTALMSDDRLL